MRQPSLAQTRLPDDAGCYPHHPDSSSARGHLSLTHITHPAALALAGKLRCALILASLALSSDSRTAAAAMQPPTGEEEHCQATHF